ncbi:HEPN domain-containing protein [Limnobacter sp.]|uniref:HEPN domain-containing protein n=1 Tax=Limnobacter sp. TaxID=2003368 RepID=UPI0031200878
MSTGTNHPRRGFVYQFKVEDEIAYASLLTDGDRASAECNIVDVIYESFVITADQDYLTARLLAQSGLYRAFYWAAAQTVEKYLKAFLLLRGKPVKSGSHGLIALYTTACALDATLMSVDISPHDETGIPDYALKHVTVFSIKEFLRDIDKFGRPDNRYNSFGVDFNSGHLFALDHFVYAFRAKIEVPDIWQSLEKVDGGLLDVLKKNNPWFATGAHAIPESEKLPATVRLAGAVTKLDFLVAQIQIPSYKLALRWLNKMMKLPVELQRMVDGM